MVARGVYIGPWIMVAVVDWSREFQRHADMAKQPGFTRKFLYFLECAGKAMTCYDFYRPSYVIWATREA